ncbi:MAG: FtsH protease activity modulator HflK [Pseudomonadota bacterium]|nr:FtsH protease activity modulator HflK [Gammaproteobacteria bacterium]MEC9359163.1 FtsH protease activity modulator HflK [Pseudomonadota bacterium]
MAWNEPGGGRDPWNNNGGGRRSGGNTPDVDEILKRLKARFGSRGGKGGKGFSGAVMLLLLAIVALWGASGFYMVNEREQAVVLRFGAYSRTEGPGLRWHVPWPFEREEKVNVTEVRESTDRSSMLTEDENIVELELKVQYRVTSAENYLFSVKDPDATLRQATRSAVRQIVGRNTFDFVVIEGRQAVADRARTLLQDILDGYETGLIVMQVNMIDARAPAQVQDAFLDAIKAREDQQRFKNEAESYSNERLPQARGTAARQVSQATGYRDSVVAEAEGDVARFTQLLTEYEKAPKVTRQRMYLDALEDVMSRTGKVLIDTNEANPMLYLPLDQLMKNRGDATTGGKTTSSLPSTSSSSSSNDNRLRERERR